MRSMVFELWMRELGILDGCLVKVDDRYLNEHIQFMWEQYSKRCSKQRDAVKSGAVK